MQRNQRQKWLVILLTSLFLFYNGELSAQELNAKVTVNHNQIQGTDALSLRIYNRLWNSLLTHANGLIISFKEMNV